jgi:hypothetical protein
VAWWDKPREGKRIALWFLVVAGPLLVALKLARPGPLLTWDYIGIAIWSLLALDAAYRLVRERRPGPPGLG